MINLYVYNNFDAFLDRYLYWYDRMVGHSVVLTLLTRTGKSDRHTGPTGRAESLTLGQLKVRSCQRTWRRIRTQSLRDGGLPSRQCLSVVVTNIDEDTKFLCFPRSHYELVKLHRTLEAILESDTTKEVKNKIICKKSESLGQILVTPPLFHVRLQLPPLLTTHNDSAEQGSIQNDPYDFAHHAAELVTESRASLESEDDLDDEELPTSIIRRNPQPAPGASEPPPTLHSSFARGPKTCIPLKLLFNYSIEPEEGVAFY